MSKYAFSLKSNMYIQQVTLVCGLSQRLLRYALRYTVEEVLFDRILLWIAEVEGGGKIRYGFSTCERSGDWKSRRPSRSAVSAKKFSRPTDRILSIIDYFSSASGLHSETKPNNRISRVKEIFRDISVSRYYLAARLFRLIKAIVCLNLP